MDPDDPLMPLSSLHDLSGKVALVTGAGSGIGCAAARRLAEAGALVCGMDLDEAGAEETAGMVGGADQAVVARGDVRNRDDVDAAGRLAVGTWGRMDVVVNSAGLFPARPVMEITPQLWDHVLGVNS